MKTNTLRQRIRALVLIVSLLAFPITMNYLSPYVILYGASQGIINASFITFGVLLAASLIFGRLWCAWVCPAGALGEMCLRVNDKPVKPWLKYIKWGIWLVWLGMIAFLATSAGGYQRVDPLLLTESGISVDAPVKYIIYSIVIGIFLLLSLGLGRRGGCHSICWMAPFMILGRKIRNLFAWPAFRLRAKSEQCIQCKKCTQNCPMSLEVHRMVEQGAMENSECILCATCADVCPQDVISLVFQSGK
jgi:ferredoxin-type protein NapH